MKKLPKLKPYQKAMLGGLKKGQQNIVIMGRGTGKSNWAKIQANKEELERLMNGETKWGEWRPTTSWIPRRSILSGRWVIGRIYKRGRWTTKMVPHSMGGHKKRIRVRQYATVKEVFKWKLKNGNDTSTD